MKRSSKLIKNVGNTGLMIALILPLICFTVIASTVENTYFFNNYKITRTANGYDQLSIENSILNGRIGEPAVPFYGTVLCLPPNEEAVSWEIIKTDPLEISSTVILEPKQYSSPISLAAAVPFQKNDAVYASDKAYPDIMQSDVGTQYMNGYALACGTFTPVVYYPASGKLMLYRKVSVRVHTRVSTNSANNLKPESATEEVIQRIREHVDNPQALAAYPKPVRGNEEYHMAIITNEASGKGFDPLVEYYKSKSFICKITTTETIYASGEGKDNQEKIRNFIIKEVNGSKIGYVLLGGDVEIVPYRGFYCFAKSTTNYEDKNIPADLYYMGLDGNWNKNGNTLYGEKDDDPDMKPDVAVGRMPFSNATEQTNLITKTIAYQKEPIMDKFEIPLLIGEKLDATTFGGDALDLVIGDKTANEMTTSCFPTTFQFTKLYEKGSSSVSASQIIQAINNGTSLVCHIGHANATLTLKMSIGQVTDNTFSKVNGKDCNFSIVNTIGCICGSFDAECIGEKMVTIKNFAVTFIGNSRYGWFDNNTNDGPSNRIQRLFVHSLYGKNLLRQGAAHKESKVDFSKFIDAPNEYEPGARRWCYYCCNLLGDPALSVWIKNGMTGIDQQAVQPDSYEARMMQVSNGKGTVHIKLSLGKPSQVKVTLYDLKGKALSTVLDNTLTRGLHTVSLNTTGDKGSSLAKGIYLVAAHYGNITETAIVKISR